MKSLGLCTVLAVALLVVGCDKRGGSTAASKPPDATAAKAVLDEVAKTGQIGSGFLTVTDYVEYLKKTDSAKAEALSKEVEAMNKLSNSPDALKAKAKEIAGKL